MKFILKLKFVLPIVLFLFTGCSKDTNPNAETNDLLQGDWKVESLTVDGVEQMGATFNSFRMNFKAESDTGGEAEWRLIDVFGRSTELEGEYEIKGDGRKITFDDDELNLDITGRQMNLGGNIDGDRWEIEAEKD